MFEPPPFHPDRPDLVAPVRLDPSGIHGPTRGQSRGPGWRRTARGLFVPTSVERTASQRVVEAAAVLAPHEAVTGWGALHWRGGRWFQGTSDGVTPREVDLVAKRHLVAPSGSRVSQEHVLPAEVELVDGVPVTTAVRSVVFEMRYAARFLDAVVALDMACYSDLVSIAEVAGYVARLGPVTGIAQARKALGEADENSWSPRETMMRGVWTKRAGLPRPWCNRPVFTLDGRHVGTPDFISPELGLVGQYNGATHLSLAGAAADVRKESAYRDLGLETITMMASDWTDLADFVRRLQAAAARASARDGSRGWTIEPPPWWMPTDTVSRRRALGEGQRARYLRYRAAA